MNFDCIVIGGGISGLISGIKCASHGLETAIISSGMNAQHFASGSIDFLGYHEDNTEILSPFEEFDSFISGKPNHPYSKCGKDIVKEALFFFKTEVENQSLSYYSNNENNHYHFTAAGAVKPTFFSQQSVYNDFINTHFTKNAKIVIINFEGYRDFYPEITAANLKKNPLFSDCSFKTNIIKLDNFQLNEKNPHELRSIDFARLFNCQNYLSDIAKDINKIAYDAEFVGMPAFIGIKNYNLLFNKLQTLTRPFIYEIPTLPPSILGMRLDNALKSRFANLGGVYIAGDKVIRGQISKGHLDYIQTKNNGNEKLYAKNYVLSSGSFLSGGLISGFNFIKEPILDLIVEHPSNRSKWYEKDFFSSNSHPFLSYGVKTDNSFNPYYKPSDTKEDIIENLFCAGSILSDYDPIKEASGSGVAISSAYFVSNKIIEKN